MQKKCRRFWQQSNDSSRQRIPATSLFAAAFLLFTLSTAQAGPTDGRVAAGTGTIKASGATTTITQTSDKLSINWRSFSIGAGEKVNFIQPGSSSIALNRVLGSSPSEIYGALTANGQVFLLNPNGVLFAPGSQVNVGGLVASTLNLSDSDFLNGKYLFSGNGGSVINRGTITAADGGYVALLGAQAVNEGIIVARQGTVVLGAGSAVTLDMQGDGLLSLAVDSAAMNVLAENKGLIQADGGYVFMTARSADALAGTVVNQSGIIQAQTLSTRSGRIILDGGPAGTVEVGGMLDASAPNGGDGGFIETSGAQVNIAAGARLNASAPYGKAGQWLLDPVDVTVDASLATTIQNALNGGSDVAVETTTGTGNGDITVSSPVTWSTANTLMLNAYRNISVASAITAGSGGSVSLKADSTGTGTGTVSFSGSGVINLSGGGIALIYYNPASGTYASPADYSSYVSGGSVTAFMLVNNVSQLQAMNTNLAGNYALGRDIDASATATWNYDGATSSCLGFSPIGSTTTATSQFRGKFNGAGHTITGLTINRPAQYYVGLFGSIGSGAQITNVRLADVNVTGMLDVGGLVGMSYLSSGSALISNVSVSGSVSCSNTNAGGIVGQAYYGTLITDSSSSATVSAFGSGYPQYFGGLVGYNAGAINNSYSTGSVTTAGSGAGGLVGINMEKGIIYESYSTGDVSAEQNVGGLVGLNAGTIAACYSTGDVTASTGLAGGLVGQLANIWSTNKTTYILNSYSTGNVTITGSSGMGAGGLVGYVDPSDANFDYAVIQYCYSTGTVTGPVATSGGLIGYVDSPNVAVGSCYWNTTTSLMSSGLGKTDHTITFDATGRSTAQMQDAANFSGWNFTTIWNIDSSINSGYPYLRTATTTSTPVVVVSPSTGGGETRSSDPAIPVIYNTSLTVDVNPGQFTTNFGTSAQNSIDMFYTSLSGNNTNFYAGQISNELQYIKLQQAMANAGEIDPATIVNFNYHGGWAVNYSVTQNVYLEQSFVLSELLWDQLYAPIYATVTSQVYGAGGNLVYQNVIQGEVNYDTSLYSLTQMGGSNISAFLQGDYSSVISPSDTGGSSTSSSDVADMEALLGLSGSSSSSASIDVSEENIGNFDDLLPPQG